MKCQPIGLLLEVQFSIAPHILYPAAGRKEKLWELSTKAKKCKFCLERQMVRKQIPRPTCSVQANSLTLVSMIWQWAPLHWLMILLLRPSPGFLPFDAFCFGLIK